MLWLRVAHDDGREVHFCGTEKGGHGTAVCPEGFVVPDTCQGFIGL